MVKSKIDTMAGPDAQLSGGYAQVTGYAYATPPCTSGACASQDLKKLAAALEETPVSVCVNAGAWNDYTGGVMSSAQCGSMAASRAAMFHQATGGEHSLDRGDCSGATCSAVCECAFSSCGDSVNACLADSTCASKQSCAFDCACGDTGCVANCAAGDDLATAAVACISSKCVSSDALV